MGIELCCARSMGEVIMFLVAIVILLSRYRRCHGVVYLTSPIF